MQVQAQGGRVQVPGASGLERLNASTRMAEERVFAMGHRSEWRFSTAPASRPIALLVFPLVLPRAIPRNRCGALMRIALSSPSVRLYTRTKVLRVEEKGDWYAVRTTVELYGRATSITWTRSLTLRHRFPIFPRQAPSRCRRKPHGAQATAARSGPPSSDRAFFGRHGNGTAVSVLTRPACPTTKPGRNQPSRFITRFLLMENETAVQRPARRGGP